MSDPWYVSEAGIRYFWRDNDDGSATITSVTDVAPILEANKRERNENDGWSPSREMRRVAAIPLALIAKWKAEEGWDAMQASFNPDVAGKLVQKLMDPDYAHLRTADGRIGLSNGVIR